MYSNLLKPNTIDFAIRWSSTWKRYGRKRKPTIAFRLDLASVNADQSAGSLNLQKVSEFGLEVDQDPQIKKSDDRRQSPWADLDGKCLHSSWSEHSAPTKQQSMSLGGKNQRKCATWLVHVIEGSQLLLCESSFWAERMSLRMISSSLDRCGGYLECCIRDRGVHLEYNNLDTYLEPNT